MSVMFQRVRSCVSVVGLAVGICASGHAQETSSTRSADELDLLLDEPADAAEPSQPSKENNAQNTQVAARPAEPESAEAPNEKPPPAQEPETVDTIPVATKEQEEPAAPGPKKSASRLIEEIVVTAQKREERLQDVPISVAAFSAEALDARGIKDASDLKMVTPGLVYDKLVGYSLVYMRGVGTEVFAPHAEPSVATYVDGVYFPMAHGLAQDFTPIERVEVLKGPQGTLFGRNSTGGAINIISQQPGDEWSGAVDVGIGSFSARRAKAYLSGPLFGGLSFSLAGVRSQDEPYYEIAESSPLEELQENKTQGVNPRLRWAPGERFSLALSAYDTEWSGSGGVVTSQTKPKPLGTAVGSQMTGPRETAFNEPGTIDAKTQVYSGQMDIKPDWLDIKLIASDLKVKTDTRWDYDNGPQAAVFFWPVNQFMDAQSAELQFLSSETTPGSDWLQWIAGLYYFRSKAGFDPMYLGSGNPRDPATSGPTTLALRGVLDTEAYAAFTQATWSVTDWMGITLGLRYQTEDRELLKASIAQAPDGVNGEREVIIRDFLADREYKIQNEDLSPRVAIDFKVLDDTLLYGSWSQAFKSGTINIVNVYTEPSIVRPEKTTAIELGAKGTLFDGALRYGSAIFQNKLEDLQTQVISLSSGGIAALANAAEATIRGAEIDLTWQVAPVALPGLVTTASGCYLDSRYDSFPEGTGFDEQTGLGFGPGAAQPARDFSGNRTVRTPEFSGSFGISYTMDVPGGNLEFGPEVYYNSGYFFDSQNVTRQPEYYLLNARASYFLERWNLRLSAFGRNLTDELYYQNIFANDFGEAATGGPPPSWGASLSWSF